jgi:hypothetical protein
VAAALSILTLSIVAHAQSEIIALPPLVVDATISGPRWRYTQSPEFEILARCSDDATREIATSYHRLHLLLNAVLPPRLQMKSDVPRALILYDEELLPASVDDMIDRVQRLTPTLAPTPVVRKYEFLHNPALFDSDSGAIFLSVPATGFDSDSDIGDLESGRVSRPVRASRGAVSAWTNLTPGYVSYLLRNRTPPLPYWFTSGFLAVYDHLRFPGDTIELGPMTWLSSRETHAVVNEPDAADSLLPMKEFFAAQVLAGDDKAVEKKRVWFAQAELFVRWGMDVHPPAQSAAFWKFVDCASAEPMSEALCRECFGTDFFGLRENLKVYLPEAVRASANWSAGKLAKLPRLEFRNATAGDIARIKGEWERLATSFVRGKSGDLESKYLAQARRTLQHAYDLGNRDPRLLAEFGLCEYEANNAGAARELLEAAAKQQVVRPRVYLELARLRWAAAREQPAAGGKLSAAQVAEIVAPLAIARRQLPLSPEVFELFTEVWASCLVAPQADDFAVLREGVSLFPTRTELLYRVASLYAANGRVDEASKLIGAGLSTAQNTAASERLRELQSTLAR